jgi:methylglutaconyl-CoA hydratase
MSDHVWGTVAIASAGPVRRLRLTRPAERNAISGQMIDELMLALAALAGDEECRVVVLEGDGKSFCAGADIEEMKASGGKSFDANLRDAERLAELFRALDTLARPVIGRVHGHCLGGGVGLAACCDAVVASEQTAFAFSETRLGIVPAVISPYALRRIGATHARRYFLSGERFTALEARRIGLISEVAPLDGLDAAVDRLVDEMMAAGPEAIARIKGMIARAGAIAFEDYRQWTPSQIAQARAGEEAQAGLAAFKEKISPPWVPTPEPFEPK